jgi:hypothetical protein
MHIVKTDIYHHLKVNIDNRYSERHLHILTGTPSISSISVTPPSNGMFGRQLIGPRQILNKICHCRICNTRCVLVVIPNLDVVCPVCEVLYYTNFSIHVPVYRTNKCIIPSPFNSE